jgi:hypothetical protein
MKNIQIFYCYLICKINGRFCPIETFNRGDITIVILQIYRLHL